MYIQTPSGTLRVLRRIGISYEYYETPEGFFTQNPQKGFVPVPTSSKALSRAISVADSRDQLQGLSLLRKRP